LTGDTSFLSNQNIADFNQSVQQSIENAVIEKEIPFKAYMNLEDVKGFEESFAYLTRS